MERALKFSSKYCYRKNNASFFEIYAIHFFSFSVRAVNFRTMPVLFKSGTFKSWSFVKLNFASRRNYFLAADRLVLAAEKVAVLTQITFFREA